jgi:hypothetical protein
MRHNVLGCAQWGRSEQRPYPQIRTNAAGGPAALSRNPPHWVHPLLPAVFFKIISKVKYVSINPENILFFFNYLVNANHSKNKTQNFSAKSINQMSKFKINQSKRNIIQTQS